MNSKLFALAFTCLFGLLSIEPATSVVAQTAPLKNASESVNVDSASAQSSVTATDAPTKDAAQTATASLIRDKARDKEKGKDKPQKQKQFALTFDDIKFDMEKTDKFDRKMLTEKINSYHGGKVKIRGYIRPNLKQDGIRKFIFVRDNKECCFGEGAAIFDNILVRMAKNKTTRYTVRPITIEGNFVLKEYIGPGGDVWSLYRMYDAEVK
jgi:uncharacterized membrane protein YcgQ (UPF0703/DUF1980 family)